jgi:hypothetical protein
MASFAVLLKKKSGRRERFLRCIIDKSKGAVKTPFCSAVRWDTRFSPKERRTQRPPRSPAGAAENVCLSGVKVSVLQNRKKKNFAILHFIPFRFSAASRFARLGQCQTGLSRIALASSERAALCFFDKLAVLWYMRTSKADMPSKNVP